MTGEGGLGLAFCINCKYKRWIDYLIDLKPFALMDMVMLHAVCESVQFENALHVLARVRVTIRFGSEIC